VFSRDAKDEIAGVRLGGVCCPASFVQALSLFGRIKGTSVAGAVTIASERASVIRSIVGAAHRMGIDAHADRAPQRRVGARWSVTVPVRASTGAPAKLPHRLCCRRAWLRAAFLACGSVNDPARGYHLEFYCRDDRAARAVCDVIAALGGDAGVTRRRGRPLAYVKDAQTVCALLGHMGANHAVLRLEGQRALGQTKNSIRRSVNGEAANAARAAASAARQREAAVRAIAKPGIANMTSALREAAQLRIAHPTRTLRELARYARPPISKAAMASRLRLLERLAKR
jgi:DNA-binding transcriptional regulator WhiA